ncbi:uncharacterized protein B0I36DRAFT_228784, partial [Microdochium trichocladiopsis]
IANAFGRQTRDALWRGMNPSWDTPAGARASAERTLQRWKSITTDKDGQRNTIYLIATIPTTPDAAAAASAHVPDGENEARTIVGIAIWAQISEVPGYGDPVHPDIRDADGKGYNLAAELYPDDKREQRYIAQAIASLVKRRKEVIREKAAAFENRTLLEGEKPANFHLDLCVVDPVWQRRGIAQKLVGWGLAEARRRGGLECSTEASDMGRGAYMKLGFKPEGDEPKDIVFEVDEEFKNEGRASLPPNLFLRTG